MAYEPLTPYKSKDDPLWYVFDENQNFKTFDTRDKAMNHIKAVKYPQNEGIEFNTSNTENQKIEPIKPQKIEFATDESNKEKKEEISWKQFGINEANAIKTAPQQLGLGLFDTAEGFINAGEYWVTSTQFLEGYYDEPKEGWSDDHKKAIDVFNKEIMAKGKINDPEYIKKVFQDNGLTRSRMYGGRVVTELPAEKQREFIEKNTTIQMLRTARKNLKDIPAYDRWEDAVGDPTYLGTVLRSAPNLIAQISLARMHPTLGMAYAGGLMSGDSFQLAQPYVENGTLTPQEAVDIASQVGAFSVLWNAGPSYIWGATKPQKKIVEKMLFDKVLKKKLYKKKSLEFFTKGSIEMFQEVGDEINTMYGESKYRDLDYDEIIPRVKMSAFAGYVLGGTMGGVFAHYNNKEVPKLIDRLVEQENMMLPMNMSIDKDGYISFKVNEDDFNNKENYEFVKNIVNDKKFKKRFDPEELRKKYPDVPLNLAIFNELNTQNPNTDDVDIEYNKKLITSIMTDEDIRKANYDPDNPQWLTAELQEGEEGYEEGKRKFKVHTLGSNIYNSSGGSIVLSEGVSQDVFVEELTEVLYKKLATTNPKLKRRIDRWIKKTTKILDNNKIGGPRNIELFSKFYTFNYLGYADTEFDLGQIAKIPKGILKDFDAIMGEQKDGTNLSFLFKGKSKGDVITETETETDINEPSQTVETPEESFRLIPEKGFRAGDGPSKIDNVNLMFGRGTGHFGSGYYFFGEKDKAVKYAENNGFRPITEIDLKGKNLYKVKSKKMEDIESLGFKHKDYTFGLELHEMLKQINDQMYTDEQDYNDFKKSSFAGLSNVVKRLKYWNDIEVSPELIINAINSVRSEIKNNNGFGGLKTPTASTRVMKALGYDGIDVRGIEGLDNASFGSVLYEDFSVDNILTKNELLNRISSEESFALAPAVDDFSDIVKALSNVDLIDAIDVEKFADNKEIGKYLVERTQQLQKENNIDLKGTSKGYTDEQLEIISDIISREALNEIVNNPKNAGAWYSTNMENAIKLLGIIHPEILSDENARTTFVIGLAITSNGQTPKDNLRYALQVYDFYKEKNRFPETKKEFDSAGSVSPSMRDGFAKYNSLVVEFGLDDANQFLNTRFKVKDLKDLGYNISGENVDQKLPGSVIFGPKVGGAFYPNLQGAYEYVTMDRWFMRTMGRLTGELTKTTYDLQLKRFRSAMLKSKSQLLKFNVDKKLFKTDDDYAISIASDVLRIYAKGSYQKKTELNKASNTLMKQFDLVDSPRGGNQRVSFRKLMKLATDKVNQKVKENNIEFSKLYPADLQAIIWFPEKRLFGKLRKSKSILRETSYEDEAKEILKSRGYDDKRIADILNTNEDYATKGGAFNQENEKSYRLAPKDPDELTPEVIDELDRAEKLPQIYSQPPRESKFSISKKFNIDYKAGRSLEKVLKPISSALEKIHPKLKRALRDFEYRLLTKTRERRIIVKNFYDKAKSMSQEDYYHLDLAFKNADGDKINELIKKYKLKKEYKALRKMLDDIGQEYVDAGGELGYIENYIPRQVKDLDGLRQNIFGLDPKLQTLYKKLEKQAIKEKGKELDLTEKEHIINMIMRGYKTLNEGKPGSAKPRVIKLVDNDMNEYYAHSSEAMMNHIEQMTDVIEKRNFLGKNELTEDGIAKYIREVNEETPLTQDQEMAIKEILNARINPAVTSKITGAIKNSTYILTMGNPLSAITQLGDLVWAYDQAGVFQTIKTIFSKKNIKIEDLGIEKIGQEFTSSTPLAGAVDRVFKIVGIAKIDKLGKETLINSVFNRYVKEAKKGKPSKQLLNDIDKYFDSKDSKKIKKLMNDLKQGKITEDVQMLVFNKLLDHQPVTQSEMPQVYLQSGLSRLSYQLKTFTIRQLDVIRGKIVNDIVKAKTYKEKALGLGKFVRFLALWVFAGATKDIIKDLILNRPVDAEDYVYENLLQFIGASRYQIYQAKRYGLRGIISRFVFPPSAGVVEDLIEDVRKPFKDKKLTKKQEKMTAEEIEELRGDEVREDAWNLIQRVPLVGKIAFWRSKSGRNRILKQKLRELKDELDKNSVSNKDIEKYEEYLEEALSLDMITPTLYKKRLLQLYKQ